MFKVKRTSWHYRWYVYWTAIVNYDRFHREEFDAGFDAVEQRLLSFKDRPRDFCSYWRGVAVWPAIRLAVNLLAYVPLAVVAYVTGASGAAGLGTIAGGLLAFTLLLAAISYVWMTVADKLSSAKKPKLDADSVIAQAYDAYKGKYCPMVEFVKEDGK